MHLPSVISDGNGIKASNSGGIVEKTIADAEKLLVDFSAEEKLQTPELVGSASTGKSLGDGIDLETNDNTIPSKRKRDQMVMDFDTSATDARKDVCKSSSDDIYSPSACKTYDVFETCVACSKRQRY